MCGKMVTMPEDKKTRTVSMNDVEDVPTCFSSWGGALPAEPKEPVYEPEDACCTVSMAEVVDVPVKCSCSKNEEPAFIFLDESSPVYSEEEIAFMNRGNIMVDRAEYMHLLACKEKLQQLLEVLDPDYRRISVDNIINVPTNLTMYAVGE